jgi:hypothetical protein
MSDFYVRNVSLLPQAQEGIFPESDFRLKVATVLPSYWRCHIFDKHNQ